jgi:D-alanyl-D-alanine carboxypeptidase
VPGKTRISLYVILVCVIFLPLLAWETDRNMVRRWAYPLTGHLAAWSTRCDEEAPSWLKEATGALAIDYASPTNQLVFVSASGKQSGCVNGWLDTPLLSARTTSETRFRFASLSKVVAFIGLAQPDLATDTHWLDDVLVQTLKVPPPYLDARIEQVRIRHLLNHSAGFDRLRVTDPMVVNKKTPWCPDRVGELAHTPLQFSPGTRYAYANLSYCLAAVAYEQRFGRSLWDVLDQNMHLSTYGVDYLYRADSPVTYNFMNEPLRGPAFVDDFDWRALKAPMGMTGHAAGLARFIAAHRGILALAPGMHDGSVACNERVPESCYDGFLERRRIGDTQVWLQRGYLYGMSALFLVDQQANFIVWLGAGSMNPLTLSSDFLGHSLIEGTTRRANP